MDSSPVQPARAADLTEQPASRPPALFLISIFAVAIALLMLVLAVLSTRGGGKDQPATASPDETPSATTAPATQAGASPTRPTGATTAPPTARPGITTVACGDILVPVDKQHALPSDCGPPDLRQIPAEWSLGGAQYLRSAAAAALIAMFEAAQKEGIRIYALSGYRSYDTQAVVFNNEVATYGLAVAEKQSARPGHSEHQLGTTMDITSPSVNNDLVEAFGDTAEGKWLAENAHRWGFALSYPRGKEAITGYIYEPWHFRYLGVDVAAAYRSSGKALNEYLAAR